MKKSEKIDWEKTTNFMGIKRNIMTSNTSNQQHRTPATNYGGPECPDAVWEKATPIPGKNPDEWRLDVNGNIIGQAEVAEGPEYANIQRVRETLATMSANRAQ